jgi:hypothetical protein
MEIEFSAPEGQNFYLVIVAVLLLLVTGLGWLGYGVTRVGPDGRAVVMTWTDYRVIQAEKVYIAERAELRSAVEEIAQLLNKNASPVEAQIHLIRIEKSTGDGLPELAEARAAVFQATDAVRAYSLGKISRDEAAGAINHAAELLAE